jgi:hypothetical protein
MAPPSSPAWPPNTPLALLRFAIVFTYRGKSAKKRLPAERWKCEGLIRGRRANWEINFGFGRLEWRAECESGGPRRCFRAGPPTQSRTV